MFFPQIANIDGNDASWIGVSLRVRQKTCWCLQVAAAVFFLFPSILLAQSKEHGDVDFNTQIRPILTSKCFLCHGPDESSREADLRLDSHEAAVEIVIDLDDPESSELLARIESDDPDYVMPPADHGQPLTEEQQELMKRWIASGARYDQHWAYQRPVKADVPISASPDSVVNEIDSYVHAKAATNGLTPATSADRHTIIRRLALDLTGLPPTLEEVEKFVSDTSEDAYEKIVDDYLHRDSYGERWAATWLDLARYADSAGFAEDRKREIWLYRDYVIRAYNENKSFRRFTLEQIAGDQLPDASDQTHIATAFHRNTLTNSEGGTDDEEFRSAAVVDRVNTTMAVWMGTTIACAQCHTHKYDPITQTEYFQVYDFLNQTADTDRPDEAPVLSLYSDDAKQQRKPLLRRLAELEGESNELSTEREFEKWVTKLSESPDSLSTSGRYVRIDLPGQSKFLSLAEVEVFNVGDDGARENVALQGTATQSSVAYGGSADRANDGNTSGDFSEATVTHSKAEANPWWQVDLGQEFPIQEISVWNRTGDAVEHRLDGYSLSILDEDEKVVWNRVIAKASVEEQKSTVQQIPAAVRKLLARKDNLSPDESKQLRAEHGKIVEKSRQAAISVVQQELRSIKPISTVPVMESVAEKDRRTTKVHLRGSYVNTGDAVTAATPTALHEFPGDVPKSRLAFAEWLVADDNPLTARVVVNRYWEQLFGIGIVATSEEFGSQGELPTHPQLLDWLAVDLMEHEWDTRHLVKKLVMSATYRQSSVADAEALGKDPNNRWLARGPRVRLSAEMVRDQALAVSGLLSQKMYGSPVQPPQPKIGLKPAFTGTTTDWEDSVGADRYRRALYTEWRRSAPYPSMSTFDMNSREVCEVSRTSTNTPLQALVTLNDPVYVEAAKSLARRALERNPESTDTSAVDFAFRVCLIRPPSSDEVKRLVKLLNQSREHFADNLESAKQLAVDPLQPPNADFDVDHVELASWVAVANVLLNLDEMLMKP